MGFKDGLTFLSTGIGAFIVFLIILAISLSGIALGITDVVLGSKYLDDNHFDETCHLTNLPVYLIVLGAISLTTAILSLTFKKEDGKKGIHPLTGLFSMACIGLLIWGMTLVWNTEQKNCPESFYNYAYYRTIVIFFINVIIIGILTVGLIGIFIYQTCLICCDQDSLV